MQTVQNPVFVINVFQRNLRHTHNAVDRRADIVRHMGKKITLCNARGIRSVCRILQQGIGLPLVRNDSAVASFGDKKEHQQSHHQHNHGSNHRNIHDCHIQERRCTRRQNLCRNERQHSPVCLPDGRSRDKITFFSKIKLIACTCSLLQVSVQAFRSASMNKFAVLFQRAQDIIIVNKTTGTFMPVQAVPVRIHYINMAPVLEQLRIKGFLENGKVHHHTYMGQRNPFTFLHIQLFHKKNVRFTVFTVIQRRHDCLHFLSVGKHFCFLPPSRAAI